MIDASPFQLPALAHGLRTGTIALPDLIDQLEARFSEREGEVAAWIPEPGRFARLREKAAALLARHPDAARRPALFGVPIGVKDIFHVDGFPTSAGSRLPSAELAGPQAASVSKLKAAGALILGKTVTTEFAYFAPGPTRNPRRLKHTPGGSSSGSAAAVAAGMCPLALGTQTIGSIGRPASFCGVVGYKPSYDRIAKDGVIPLASGLDHVGFFTTDVAGAELAASVLCDAWKGAPPTRRGVLGVPQGPYLERLDGTGRELFTEICQRLKVAGWQIHELDVLGDIAELEERHRLIVAAQAARHHRAWYPRFAELYRPQTRELLDRGLKIDDDALSAALLSREALRQALTAAMDERGLDLWLTPAAPGPAPEGLASTGDPIMNLPFTHAGLPTLVIPASESSEELPFGVQLASRMDADEELFAWGTALEESLR